MKKGQKFVMKLDKHFGRNGGFKIGDIIEYTGNKKSSTGMLSTFVNQNGIVLKTYTLCIDKFLADHTNVL